MAPLVLALLSLPIFSSVNGSTTHRYPITLGYAPEFLVCDISSETCGHSCYDPSTQACFSGVVCQNGESRCGGRCFSPESEYCSDGRIVCPKGELACGSGGCYDSSTHTCSHGYLICLAGEETCGSWLKQCYSPSTQICIDGATVCSQGESLCGPTCYRPSSTQNCTGRYVCQPGQEVCDYLCYYPSEQTCHAGPYWQSLCKVGEEKCGKRCIDPKEEECTQAAREGCHPGQESCGSYSCYTPGLETCSLNGYRGTVCQPEEAACDNECIDPTTTSCHGTTGGTGFRFEKACPIGKEVCGTGYSAKCYSRAAGQKCLEEKMICNEDEELCGYDCYSPDLKKCQNGTLCDLNQLPCGQLCYDPQEQKCINLRARAQ